MHSLWSQKLEARQGGTTLPDSLAGFASDLALRGQFRRSPGQLLEGVWAARAGGDTGTASKGLQETQWAIATLEATCRCTAARGGGPGRA